MTVTSAQRPPIHDSIRPPWLPEAVWPFPLGALEVEGRRVVYTDTGGPGPVVLLCHAGMWSFLWRDVIAALTEDHRCVTLDPPGFGLSERVPRDEQHLTTVARAVGAVLDHLDLRDVTLVVHDLGGVSALAAVEPRLDRIRGLVAVATFGWRPRGIVRPALRAMGSAPVRELDASLGILARGSATRFGVGRRLDRAGRRAWRSGQRDRPARRGTHRIFRDAARNHRVADAAESALIGLADRPVVTVFGRFGDYFGFQRAWRSRRPDVVQHVVPRGLHFPMCDDPQLVANAIRDLAAR